jgi:hypothetical protein
MTKKLPSPKRNTVSLPKGLLEDLRTMIRDARQGVARTVNSAQTALYWNVGERIRRDILHKKRADYGA